MAEKEPIQEWYIQLLEAMQATAEAMGEREPHISFNYGYDLEAQLGRAKEWGEYPYEDSYISFGLDGADMRIISYHGGKAIRLFANMGSLAASDEFCRGVLERSEFPLLIEDRYEYSLKKNYSGN